MIETFLIVERFQHDKYTNVDNHLFQLNTNNIIVQGIYE